MAVITISRQLGARGGEVGRLVAKKLAYDLVERDKLTEAARKFPLLKQEDLARIDEIKPRFLESIFGGRRADYFDVLSTVVYNFAEKGRVVIIGGGAQVFLKDVPGTLHIRINSSFGQRVKNIAERHNVSIEDAQKIINQSDRNRAHFFKTLFDVDWQTSDFYDIVLRTDKLDVNMAANIIAEASDIKEIEAAWDVSQSILNKLSLTGRVRLVLRSEGYENLRGISVNVTPQGYVHLTGHVSSEEEKARAEEIIRSIEGVGEVINELTLLEFTPPIAPY